MSRRVRPTCQGSALDDRARARGRYDTAEHRITRGRRIEGARTISRYINDVLMYIDNSRQPKTIEGNRASVSPVRVRVSLPFPLVSPRFPLVPLRSAFPLH